MESIEAGTGQLAQGELSKTPEAPEANTFHFTCHHVLYGKLRPYLNKVIAPEFEGKCSTELVPLLPSQRLDRRYLAYFLRTPNTVEAISNKVAGARMPRADMSFVMSLGIPLPPLERQRSIIDLLSRAENIVRMRREAEAKAKEIIPALFVEMFGNPSTNAKGFMTRQLDECTDEIYRYPTYFGIQYEEFGVPEVRGELLLDSGELDSSPNLQRYISQATSARYPRTVLHEGDVVMSVRGTIGKIALISRNFVGANMTANLLRIAPSKSIVNGQFLSWFLKIRGLRDLVSGTTIQTIKAAEFKRVRVAIPSLAMQRLFTTRLEQANQLVASQASASSVAMFGFQSLLAGVFGEGR